MKEITFIIIAAFLFTAPYILASLFNKHVRYSSSSNKNNFSLADCIYAFKKNIITSGVFISLIFLLKDLKTPEVFLQDKNFANQIIIKLIVALRPLVYSLILYIIVSKIIAPLNKNHKNNNDNKDNLEAPQQEQNLKLTLAESLLSKRELEVAKLAAKGMTNLQIAEELYISPETVKRHLATVYAKLEISSRTEIGKFFIIPLLHQ